MPDADSFVEIRTTFPTAVLAEACAARLVQLGLAACVQVEGPVRSTYRWQGAVERAEEFRCTLKTTAAAAAACIAAIRAEHPYETPELLVSPVTAAEGYAAWLRESVGGPLAAGGEPASPLEPVPADSVAAARPAAGEVAVADAGRLYDFFITLHPLFTPEAGAAPASAEQFTDGRGRWPVLAVPRPLVGPPLAIGFDEALGRLGGIERLFVEPDGSFVWTSPREGLRWQVDGNLFEREGRVQLCDMKGTCPAEGFDRLLTAFGWPGQRVMMELVQAGVFLDEPTFRRHAAAKPPPS